MSDGVKRRDFLKVGVAGAATGLAVGCTGGEDGDVAEFPRPTGALPDALDERDARDSRQGLSGEARRGVAGRNGAHDRGVAHG